MSYCTKINSQAFLQKGLKNNLDFSQKGLSEKPDVNYSHKTADLHIHTSFSDGILSPEQVIMKANSLGLSAIAITDHDTIDGIDQAISAGEKYQVEVIPGLELSAESDNEEIHILGFYIDWHDDKLLSRINEFRESRRTRIVKMMDRLSDLGINIEYDSLLKKADSNSLGRPHVAAVLVENGYVSTISEAFFKYLGNNGPVYVAKHELSPFDAVKIILDAGGIPILAHPGAIQPSMIEELIHHGLMGLEAFHPCHSIFLSNYYYDLARNHELLVTGGSDYHGLSEGKMGLGDVRLPYKFVLDLKKAKESLPERDLFID